MCGICGFAVPRGIQSAPNEADLRRMRETLRHRGPDGAGLYIQPGRVGLGHRRLAIVDPVGGAQPMATPDGRFRIVYNGEIYNHRELRPRLEARGHRFHGTSDTETILAAFADRGMECVGDFSGIFAFAVWDGQTDTLTLVRDPLGVKPLYYVTREDGTIFFASEIKALLEIGAVTPELNVAVVGDFLANRSPSGEDTLFGGVKRLPPGHVLEWADGRVTLRRYWRLSFTKPEAMPPEADLVDRFAELFERAVRSQMMADVPIGMFLSGGLDSSAIAAALSTASAEPVRTFSVAFAEREANELFFARQVAAAFATEHREVVVTPEQFFAALPGLIYHEDEPPAHPSSVPLYFVSRLAADHVKVVQTGEGSDEMLAGYAKFGTTLHNLQLGKVYRSMVPAVARGMVKRTIEAGAPARWRQRLGRTFLFLPGDLDTLYFENFSVFSRARQARLLTREFKERMGSADPYAEHRKAMAEAEADSLLDRLLAADHQVYLHELLMKQDQMSMAASIESRVPFLDLDLVKFAAGLPPRMKLRGLTTKYVLRRAMRRRLPSAILTRRKMGFPVPFGAWVRGPFQPFVADVLMGDRARSRGIFLPDAVADLLARHQAGEDHSERIWLLLNFELWHRRFLDGEGR